MSFEPGSLSPLVQVLAARGPSWKPPVCAVGCFSSMSSIAVNEPTSMPHSPPVRSHLLQGIHGHSDPLGAPRPPCCSGQPPETLPLRHGPLHHCQATVTTLLWPQARSITLASPGRRRADTAQGPLSCRLCPERAVVLSVPMTPSTPDTSWRLVHGPQGGNPLAGAWALLRRQHLTTPAEWTPGADASTSCPPGCPASPHVPAANTARGPHVAGGLSSWAKVAFRVSFTGVWWCGGREARPTAGPTASAATGPKGQGATGNRGFLSCPTSDSGPAEKSRPLAPTPTGRPASLEPTLACPRPHRPPAACLKPASAPPMADTSACSPPGWRAVTLEAARPRLGTSGAPNWGRRAQQRAGTRPTCRELARRRLCHPPDKWLHVRIVGGGHRAGHTWVRNPSHAGPRDPETLAGPAQCCYLTSYVCPPWKCVNTKAHTGATARHLVSLRTVEGPWPPDHTPSRGSVVGAPEQSSP